MAQRVDKRLLIKRFMWGIGNTLMQSLQAGGELPAEMAADVGNAL